MKVNIRWGGRNAQLKYTVRGDTLEKVQSVLLAREEVGQFVWTLPYKLKFDAQQTITSLALSPASSIRMPTWPQYRLQPQVCQDQWDSMWKALQSHEKGHADLFESALATLVARLENMQTMQVGECETYITDRMKELDKQQRQYDVQTDHGRSRGVELTITEPCRSQA